MYKSKLQELCHKNQWGLPKYTSMKYGPDHNPRFGASVLVRGIFFDSLLVSKSNKEAHNHAAMLAFLHVTSGTEPLSIAPVAVEIDHNHVHSNVSGVRNVRKTNNGEANIEETYQSLKMLSDAEGVIEDIHCQYKSQLHNYARQRNLDLPMYSCECDQGSHASHFKATVTVGDQTFESAEFFNTLKEAESGAAKAALMSLLVESFQQDESRAYKNLLQELVQREDLSIPVYKTTKCGEPHKPNFFSTVELEGEIFHGKAAKSKKQAELDAARAAYIALNGRGSTQFNELTSLGLKGHARKCTESPGVACDSLRNLKNECTLARYAAQSYLEPKQNNDLAILSRVDSSSSISPSGGLVSPSNMRKNDTSVVKSYLLCNRVRVYRQFPNYSFPKDITVLPIGDDKWVAVSLEFPNEEKNY
ncbi:Double-stranded RNA-binding domain containing protein [Parasponia andersonii]|uniref:Double-stranded RNA-binding domain containing protein n=1 Tax=Parasponia andersonii TaxID=3476 RepID=A0A2P5CDV1_PARAD|nr:Double-stranded RNA-binding domain containing protein [Parasponia andersonii]